MLKTRKKKIKTKKKTNLERYFCQNECKINKKKNEREK